MKEDILTIMKSIIPAIHVLHKDDAIRFIDKANESLSETGYMFLLTGNGVQVVSHSQVSDLVDFFDKPMSDYSG